MHTDPIKRLSLSAALRYAIYNTLDYFGVSLLLFILWLINTSFLGAIFLLPLSSQIMRSLSDQQPITTTMFGVVLQTLSTKTLFTMGILIAVYLLISAIFSLAITTITLTSYDYGIPTTRKVSPSLRQVISEIIASVLYLSIVGIGLMLFIVPGVVWAIKYSFYRYSIVDKNAGPFAALKDSALITAGIKKELLWIWIILAIFHGIASAYGGIGILLTIPLSYWAYTALYRQLVPQPS